MPPAPSQYSVWRSRQFLWFAAGNTANNIGDAVYAVALPLLVYQTSHSFLAMGTVAAMAPLPLVLGPVIGVLVDRLGPSSVVVPALLVQLIAGGLMPLLGSAHSLTLGDIYGLGLAVQLTGGFYRGGWMAAIPQMFPREPAPARAALGACYMATTVLGPLMVGLLLPRVGYTGLLAFNSLTFVAPIVIAYTGVPVPGRATGTRRRQSPVADLLEGWLTLRRFPALLRAVLLSSAGQFVAAGGVTTMLMFYMRSVLGFPPSAVSLIVMMQGIGGVAATLAMPAFGNRSLRRVLPLGMALTALTLFLLLLNVWWAVPLTLLAFPIGDVAVTTSMELTVYSDVPPGVLGRVNGIIRLAAGVPATVCPIVLSVITGLGSIHTTFLIIAVFSALVAITVLWNYRSPAARAAPAGQAV